MPCGPYKRMGRLCLGASLLLTLAGSCSEPFPRAPVTGVIRLDSEPLAGARVGFEPTRQGDSPNAGPGSYATTDEHGRFDLTALDGRKGAVIGRHRVWVRTFQAREGPNGQLIPVAREKLPLRYNERTELTFSVPPEGTSEADFNLSSK